MSFEGGFSSDVDEFCERASGFDGVVGAVYQK
jgi:hypothetical protein